jgi:AAA domain (dynein-related subfamily)
MAVADITHAGVIQAINEFDSLGREAFLSKYGFGLAIAYSLVYEGNVYASKAIVGAAHGYDRPDLGPLTSEEFSGGRTGAARVLESLGFEVETPSDGDDPVWLIRAGQQGQAEELAVSEGMAVVGWSELGPLTPEMSREDIKTMINTTYGEQSDSSLGSQARSPYRFIHEVSVGDLVVLPLRTHPQHVAIGRITGPYVHRPDERFFELDAVNTRSVYWIEREVAYERFDPDLQEAFGQQGTLSKIGKPNAAARILSALAAPPELIHLVVKWSEKFGANTVEEHRSVADKTGAVWWGLIGTSDRPKLAAKRIETISEQLDRGQPTHVFISGPTNWRAQLDSITATRADVEEELIPSYYHEDWSYGLWVKLKDFQSIERSWLTEHLELASAPGKPLSEGALSNQTNPLIVRDLSGETGSTTRVWWVCQGVTRGATSELGVLWAPKVAKDGTSRGFWRALEDARAGDIVLHYADSHIRGVSTVTEEAVDAPNPAGPSDNWQEGDGWLVNVDYRELDEAISLASIPIEWRIAEQDPFTKDGGVRQGYFSALSDRFAGQLAGRFPQLELPGGDSAITKYVEPQLAILEEEIAAKGLRLTPGTVRRYHVSLKTRGFVILAGISGGGKTWLAEAYADVVGAESLVVPVAPNWTTNEDLLGYLNPIDGVYRHTEFSRFLMRAASEYSDAQAALRQPRPFHLILDEMNLARVEYYFAKFLSAMEARSRKANAAIVLSEDLEVPLPENLVFIGTVNVDETTFGFADKVYDRAQLIELEVPRESLDDYMTGMVFREALLEVWDAVQIVAPFAFRIVDEINSYVQTSVAGGIDISWQRAFDEQLLQKVLPKIKGTDPRIGNALNKLVGLTDPNFPMTHERVGKMLENFNLHGFVSYF